MPKRVRPVRNPNSPRAPQRRVARHPIRPKPAPNSRPAAAYQYQGPKLRGVAAGYHHQRMWYPTTSQARLSKPNPKPPARAPAILRGGARVKKAASAKTDPVRAISSAGLSSNELMEADIAVAVVASLSDSAQRAADLPFAPGGSVPRTYRPLANTSNNPAHGHNLGTLTSLRGGASAPTCEFFTAPAPTRTGDLQVRSLTLYPAELRAQ